MQRVDSAAASGLARPADPCAAGHSAGARRRAPGLRREELATLAGLSVDYLSRLDQGRAANPSPGVVAALARSLGLSDEERRHLYLVAGQVPPGAGTIDSHITPGVQRMLDRLEEMPVVVYDAIWELVAWNPLAAALIGDLKALVRVATPPEPRLGPSFTMRLRGSPATRRRTSASSASWSPTSTPRAPPTRRTSGSPRWSPTCGSRSERFEALWAGRPVAVRTASRKTVEHPEVGPITVDCDVLVVRGVVTCGWSSTRPRQAPPDAEKLALLGVVGLQRMASA